MKKGTHRKRRRKTAQLGVRVEPEQLARYDAAAAAENLDLSDWCREVLDREAQRVIDAAEQKRK